MEVSISILFPMAAVRLRVMQAVSALTGLGSDKISVIKMKRQ